MTKEITIDDLKRYRALVETGSVLDKNTVLNIINHAGEAAETIQRKQNAIDTLDRIITQQCQAALDATGLHHLIDEDGDGDWSAVWEGLQELGEAKREAERNADTYQKLYEQRAESREQAEQAVARVRELHERITVVVNGRWETGHCKFCYEQDFSSDDAVWPCPTIRALDGDPNAAV